MNLTYWLSNNYIEVFGAVTGIIYVFLEIRQTIWLWPVGIITSAVYIWVFFSSKFYADMSLQGYYLVISVFGWYWWYRGVGRRAQGTGQEEDGETKRQRDEGTERQRDEETLKVTRIDMRTSIVLSIVFVILYLIMRLVLRNFTDSPVPEGDSFITSLSIVATWMLARKIYEHWYLWIVVNFVSMALFIFKGLYPTMILYAIYGIMSFAGLKAWRETISVKQVESDDKG